MGNLNGGEITLLLMLIFNLVFQAYMHGEPKSEKHDFFVSLVASVISFIIYKWAGLF